MLSGIVFPCFLFALTVAPDTHHWPTFDIRGRIDSYRIITVATKDLRDEESLCKRNPKVFSLALNNNLLWLFVGGGYSCLSPNIVNLRILSDVHHRLIILDLSINWRIVFNFFPS